jgi:ligand-binding sensor domain-containing protein
MTKIIQSLKENKRGVIITLSAVAVLFLTAIVIYMVKTNNRLAAEREQIASAARVDVQETQLRAPATDGFTAFLNSSDVRATASLSGMRYLATSGGLIVLDENGSIKRRYTTLDGLTDNDLTALAVFNNKLFIGTGASGMMSFDGNSFTAYRFVKPKATRVSAMLVTENELLIGTLDGGLFEYDGTKFVRRLNSATGADFNRVTALLANQSRIYIGTQDKGLYVWREAHIEHFSTAEGLPSLHVTGLTVMPTDEAIAVATDFGVATLNEANEIAELSKQANITSLAVSGGRIWAGLFSGGVIEIKRNNANGSMQSVANTGHQATDSGLLKAIPTSVYAGEGKLFALTQEGAFERDEQAKSPAFENLSSAIAGDKALTSAHITSLALDDSANLWVGYFDRGVDIIAPETRERLSHIEDERVREVNFIAIKKGDDHAFIATSRGLVQLDSRLQQTVLTREQNGLIDNAIAHISFADDSSGAKSTGRMVLATSGGLTDITNNRPRSLTAFHGLSSNHLYTSGSIGSRLFAGSLAGLVELEGLRVVRTYKTSNSKLSHDWVTAVTEADGTLYIGTNGGGVDALLPTGEWLNFADELGKFEVNQNAMHFDGEKLFVGTSDRGVLVYNTRERRWTRIGAGLTSQNVTAITTDDRFVYVGTLNGLTRIEKRVIG